MTSNTAFRRMQRHAETVRRYSDILATADALMRRVPGSPDIAPNIRAMLPRMVEDMIDAAGDYVATVAMEDRSEPVVVAIPKQRNGTVRQL